MRIGIIGLAQSGKRTLFGLLTGARIQPSHGRIEFPVGAGPVPDERVKALAAMAGAKKLKHAEIEWVLFPTLPSDAKAREEWFEEARTLDGLCLCLRQFADPGVYHPKGSVDPARDLEAIDLDLAIADLAAVEVRLERLAGEKTKRTAAEREKQKEVFEKLRGELDAGRPLRGLALTEAEKVRLSGQRFLSRKDCLVVVNVDEAMAADAAAQASLAASLPVEGRRTLCVSAKIEEELAELEDPAERAEFMASLGISEGAVARLARAAFATLGWITFFTFNREQVDAWPLKKGSTAVDAAGAIHTDFARGFIRAESMTFDDIIAAGSEKALRERGKIATRGRDYVVEDGDLINILADV